MRSNRTGRTKKSLETSTFQGFFFAEAKRKIAQNSAKKGKR
jgi:hypothetical protein